MLYLREQKQPDRAIVKGDIAAIPDFAAIKNIQNPGLNLFTADSIPALLAQLKTMPQIFHVRGILKCKDEVHHIYADIQRTSAGPISFIVLDSTNINNNLDTSLFLLQLLVYLNKEPCFSDNRVMCFSTDVQKSDGDCLIFCADFALKAHQHQSEFDQLHTANRNRLTNSDKKHVPCFMASNTQLPFSIFEHAQSKTALLRDLDTIDNPRVLEQTQKMHAQQRRRSTSRGEKCYPASIEYLRQQFLTQAMTAIASLKHLPFDY
ncbi:MAG: peptidase [Herbaspirillum sp.]|nr:peptidase [Herbaspirillum sp.]